MSLFSKRRRLPHPTPVTEDGLRKHDDLEPVDAVILAWTEAGTQPEWHTVAKRSVRDDMPLLARALDRLTE